MFLELLLILLNIITFINILFTVRWVKQLESLERLRMGKVDLDDRNNDI